MKLTPSRAQHDLADMEQRIAALVRAQPRQSVARQAAGIVASTMAAGDVIERALSYAKWINRKRLTEESNKRMRALGVAEIRTPTFIGGEDAKQLYQQVARDCARDASGALRIGESLTNEVVRRLEAMRNAAGQRGNLAHATLAFSQAEAKFASNGQRIVRGFASTGDLDRQGDRVSPRGLVPPRLPLPLLFAHSHLDVIGSIQKVEARPEGVWIEAAVASGIKRADEVWALIEQRALDCFSVGFIGLEFDSLPNGGRHYTKWTLLEVSVVAVPANDSARIARNAGGIPIKAGPARINGGYALRQPRGATGGYPLRTRGAR